MDIRDHGGVFGGGGFSKNNVFGKLLIGIVISKTAPKNPKEKTIWVEYDDSFKKNNTHIQDDEPGTTTNGDVWLRTLYASENGQSLERYLVDISNIENFKSVQRLYRLSLRVGGVWISPTTNVFLNGEWKKLSGVKFNELVNTYYYSTADGVYEIDLSTGVSNKLVDNVGGVKYSAYSAFDYHAMSPYLNDFGYLFIAVTTDVNTKLRVLCIDVFNKNKVEIDLFSVRKYVFQTVTTGIKDGGMLVFSLHNTGSGARYTREASYYDVKGNKTAISSIESVSVSANLMYLLATYNGEVFLNGYGVSQLSLTGITDDTPTGGKKFNEISLVSINNNTVCLTTGTDGNFYSSSLSDNQVTKISKNGVPTSIGIILPISKGYIRGLYFVDNMFYCLTTKTGSTDTVTIKAITATVFNEAWSLEIKSTALTSMNVTAQGLSFQMIGNYAMSFNTGEEIYLISLSGDIIYVNNAVNFSGGSAGAHLIESYPEKIQGGTL